MLALALELLGNRVPFSLYTMKQFRDCSQPGPGLLPVPPARLPVARGGVRPARDRGAARPANPRVPDSADRLAPRAGRAERDGPRHGHLVGAPADSPVRRAGYDERGRRVCGSSTTWVRIVGTSTETRTTRTTGTTRTATATRSPISRTGPISRSERASSGESTRATLAGLQRRRTNSQEPGLHKKRVKKNDAIKAIDAIDPQTVLETILSREWGNTTDARWLYGRSALEEAHRRRLEGVTPGADSWTSSWRSSGRPEVRRERGSSRRRTSGRTSGSWRTT